MNTQLEQKSTPHVVIIGGGFAGLAAAQQLKRAPVDVTLVDRRNFHLFQPLLYQVATGELSPANIASPLRAILEKHDNVEVLLDEVEEFDLESRRVQLSHSELHFDYLVVATGSTHHYFGNDHWSEFAPGLKTVEDATEIRAKILEAFEAAELEDDPNVIDELLTFVIVGGGPTGCELAGALAEVAYRTLKHEFRKIDPTQAKVILVEPSDAPLHFFPSPLPQKATRALKALGVKVMTGFHVTDVQRHSVLLTSRDGDSKETIGTRNIIWAAGVKASPLGVQLCQQAGLTAARGGRVPVTSDCSLESNDHIFVCGDLASFNDAKKGELPGLAPVASQMGHHAAKCIRADLAKQPRKTFRYFDKGSLAVIGRLHAVGSIGKFKLHGFVAWAIWLLIHLMYITRFRNRILVLVQWGWAFFNRDRSARLITGRNRMRGAATREKTHSA
ncbi:NAD(P)/FAD-dependent oxidoreductase [Stieleria sp. JC731]|uniref:NAD(P)/FAD-dependent oxidoreductase n=1 Tax=Pirellulaceae TaxID=2691357 RepID=UPI001E55CE81|nr:NAD(P)/FAD-dependent oxidoreductase [Stieleria sp. JC731]MCC9602632.1 NAD(P)/FAD-dependent oxidoreductase [Stieleria sp. JC731]